MRLCITRLRKEENMERDTLWYPMVPEGVGFLQEYSCNALAPN